MQILRTDPTGPAYRRVVERLAARVRMAADRYQLPLEPGLDLGEVRGLFPADAHQRVAERGTGHVQVFVAAAVADELPEGRHRPEYYGRSPQEWTPYRPPKYPTVVHRAQRVIIDEGYTSNVEVVDAELGNRLDESMANNQISILLIDPWSVRTPAYRGVLAEFNAQMRTTTGILVPCHDSDEESGDDALWQDVSRMFGRNRRRRNDPHDPLFRVRVGADEFDSQLAAMLTAAQNRLMEMESNTPSGSRGPAPTTAAHHRARQIDDSSPA